MQSILALVEVANDTNNASLAAAAMKKLFRAAGGLPFLLAIGLAGCAHGPANPAVDTQFNTDKNADVMNVADAAMAGNNPGMALQITQSILAHDPQNIDALNHEGAAYYAVGRCMDAIAAYRAALSIAPDSSTAQTGVGRCLLQRDAAAAQAAFTVAVRDDPGNAAAWNDLGIARDLQGNHAGAIAPYQKALLLAPGSLATEVNLGLSLALSGNAPDALAYLGPLATGANASPKIRQDYAVALLTAGREADARQVLSTDLPPDQVNAMITGLTSMITANPPAQASAAPAAPTQPTAKVAPVMVSDLGEH